jgi:hypothetical protein
MRGFGWESEAERLKRHMNMPPKEKLELLYKLSLFTRKYAVKALKNRIKKTSAK